MLDSSHITFALEWNRAIAIITLTYIRSYWLDWLVLSDILNTACNITSAAYKGVSGWINIASGHSRPSYMPSMPDKWPQ